MTTTFLTKSRWLVTIFLLVAYSIPKAWGANPTATFTASSYGWSNGQLTGNPTTKTVDCVTFDFAGGSTKPTYYTADGLRTYENCVITISSAHTISKIEFSYTNRNNGYLKSWSEGTWGNATKTWTGSATSVNCTVGHSSGTNNGQVRITSIVVTYSITAPTALEKGTITSNTAALTITDATDVGEYEIYYSTSSTAPTASTDATTTVDTKTPTLTGLTAGTTYYAWVRSKCSDDSKSAWIALTGDSFTTTSSCTSITPALNYSTTSLTAGGSHATVSSISGNTGNATPEYSVTATPAGCITVNQSTGEVTPVSAGTGTVTASFPAISTYCSGTATKDFTVVAATVNVTGVTLDHNSAALLPGETFQLTATVSPNNATDKSVTWNSGTPAKATVSNTGLVTAVAKGSSTVTVTTTDGSFTANCAVTVHGISFLYQNEAGETITGVSANATGKSISASEGSTNYKFKEWSYGTSSGMTGFANSENASTTMTGTPTGDVVVIATFRDPITVAWSVNGSTSTISATTNVSYNSTVSMPTPSIPVDCTGSTFMGWTTSANASYSGDSAPSPLYNGTSPAITGDVTFYAVFADEK